MVIDIRTLILVLGITHLIQVGVFFQQYRVIKNYQGIGWWLLWSITEVIGFGFMLLREIPSIQFIAVILQNSMIFIGAVFCYVGVMRFLDRQVNRLAIVSLYTVFIVALVYFLYVNNDINIRSVIICGALACISFITARALLVHRIPSIAASAHFNATIFLAHGAVFTYRTGMIIAGMPVNNIFTSTLFNTIPYLDALIVSLLWTFGFIIMVNQRLNAEMREAKEHFELIFHTSPDASLITRLTDGLIVNVNEGFTAFTGFNRDETIGKSTLAIHIWKNPEDHQKVVLELSEKGFCENMEAVFLRKDASPAIGIVSAKTISLQNLPHAISVIRDITERKKAEETVHRFSSELKKSNKELQEALANVKQLSGLLPICSSCKKVRDDKGYWSGVELYITKHSEVQFSHGICPDCARRLYPDMFPDDQRKE